MSSSRNEGRNAARSRSSRLITHLPAQGRGPLEDNALRTEGSRPRQVALGALTQLQASQRVSSLQDQGAPRPSEKP